MFGLQFFSREEALASGATFPDIYFSPDYGAAAEKMEGGVWELASFRDGRIIYPYVRRPIDARLGLEGRFDLISPYGYSGVFGAEDTQESEWREFRTSLREAFIERGVVSEFMRLGEIVPGRASLFGVDQGLETIRFNDTIAVNLSCGYLSYWEGSVGRSRTAIRKARRLGYSATVRPACAEDLGTEGAFRALYDETMERLEASASYRFEAEYYSALLHGLGNRLMICEVRDASQVVGSAALFMASTPFLHYHLAGSNRDAARDGANNLLIDTMVEWGCDHGFQMLHLGGGTKPNDGLFKFKAGFGGRSLQFWLARGKVSVTDYQTLTAARAAQKGLTVGQLESSGFFPAYRA